MALPVDEIVGLAQSVARAELGDGAACATADSAIEALRVAWDDLDTDERHVLRLGVPPLAARLKAVKDGAPNAPAGGVPTRTLADTLDLLGVVELRPGQDRAIAAPLLERDSLVVMATGSGKSLCYQLPSLLVPGLSLVVSPLIALMRDQVQSLRQRGIGAVAVNSSQSEEEQREAMDEIRSGRATLVYAAPERLRMGGFLSAIGARGVGLVAIDEAHCASEWGHDFRPDYRDLAALIGPLRPRAVMALTATATAPVQRDIVARLGLRDPIRVTTGADRPNIAFDAVAVGEGKGLEARKRAVITQLVRECGDRPAIVYMRTRNACETLAEHLVAQGIAARPYHAKRPDRREVQDGFGTGAVQVVCATNAFGMGVDVPNIGLVAHYSLPESMEAYYQEAGRAGRDGQPARAMLLFAVADIPGLRSRIDESDISPAQVESRLRMLAASAGPDGEVELPPGALDDRGLFEMAMATRSGAFVRTSGPGAGMRGRVVATRLDQDALSILGREVGAERSRRQQALRAIIDYGSKPVCRRAVLLRHFGDAGRPAPEGRCCDVCDPFDETLYLPAAGSRAESTPRAGGRKPRRAALTGLQNARLARLVAWRSGEAERLGWPEHRLISQALLEDLARAAPTTRTGLATTGVPRRLLDRYAHALLTALAGDGSAPPPDEPPPVAEDLWEALRVWRQKQADGNPAYTVAPNRTLEDIARAMPRNGGELSNIHGVGPAFLERHAESLLEVLSAHR
jgi:ATP-dependent DNA helicase RecQ